MLVKSGKEVGKVRFFKWILNKLKAYRLIRACRKGQNELALQLIQKGANVNAKGINGDSVLKIACKNEMSDVIVKLIQAGVNIDERQIDINKLFMFLVKKAMWDDVRKMLRKFDIEKDTKNRALIKACQAVECKTLAVLISKGADVNTQDENGDSPLIVACRIEDNGKRWPVVMWIIESGADVNVINKDKDNAALILCRDKEFYLARELVYKGLDVNVKDKNGDSMLFMACQANKWYFAEELIKQGADIDDVLVVACHKKEWSVARKLVDKGANVNMMDEKGESVLSIVRRAGEEGFERELFNKGARVRGHEFSR